MTQYNAATLRPLVLDLIAEPLLATGTMPDDIESDTDLIKAGILDSFGFIDLVIALEDRTGIAIDLASIGSEDFVTIDGLIRAALDKSK